MPPPFADNAFVDFNFNNIFSQLMISCLGMAFFMYGKKAQSIRPLLAGIAMGIYPFFVNSVWLLWAITIAVMAGCYVLREQ